MTQIRKTQHQATNEMSFTPIKKKEQAMTPYRINNTHTAVKQPNYLKTFNFFEAVRRANNFNQGKQTLEEQIHVAKKPFQRNTLTPTNVPFSREYFKHKKQSPKLKENKNKSKNEIINVLINKKKDIELQELQNQLANLLLKY